MKKRKFSIIVILILLLSGSLVSDEIVAKSKISSVTIYPDRATIIREADLTFGSGTHSVFFENLPVTLIPNSLRVSGKGTAVVKVVGLDLASQYLEFALLPEVKKLQAEIDALELEMSKTVNRIEVLNSQEKFLKSIESANAARASQEIMLGKPDTQSWERVLNFLGSKLTEVKKGKLEQNQILKDQRAKLNALKKKLNSIRPQRSTESRKVSVILDAARAGRFKLSLSYTVMRARWIPLYTMRALPDSSEIEFAMSANIQQNSGENWENAKAFLSRLSSSFDKSSCAVSLDTGFLYSETCPSKKNQRSHRRSHGWCSGRRTQSRGSSRGSGNDGCGNGHSRSCRDRDQPQFRHKEECPDPERRSASQSADRHAEY